MGDSGVLVAREGTGFVRLLWRDVFHVENHSDDALVRQRVQVASEDYAKVAPLTTICRRPVKNEFTEVLDHVEALRILEIIHAWVKVELR